MDVLSEIMMLLRTKGRVYGRLELKGPFGLQFPVDVGHFMIVSRGNCFLKIEGEPLLPLHPGDFVYLPTLKPLSLRSSPDIVTLVGFTKGEAEEYLQTRVINHGGGNGLPVSIISGCFSFSGPESRLLVEHLPAIVHLEATGPQATSWTHEILQMIANEIYKSRPGSSTIIDRLVEVLFVHALRAYLENELLNQSPSWLRALTDAQIGKSLQKMHAAPGFEWTVESLASAVGMSRSGFAAKFKLLVGITPLEHLTKWRMVRAASMIKESDAQKLDSIALSVGYASESSFRKVFQKVMGVSPVKYKNGNSEEPNS